MGKILFTICVLAYFAVVIILIFKVKLSLADTPTVPNKLYTAACAVIYVASFLYFTSTIKDGATIAFRDMNGGSFSVGALLSYGFVWFVSYVLNGGILTALLFIPYTIYIFTKFPNVTWRTKLPDYLNIDMWLSMYAVGTAIAYNLILYAFNLTDVFVLFWFF